MEEIIKSISEKISSYNIFNNLFPGIIFCSVLTKATRFCFTSESIIEQLFIWYFTGMIISRIGSVFVESSLKKIKFRKKPYLVFADYKEYITASEAKPFIATLSETNNTYRTIIALLFSMGLVYLHDLFVFDWIADANYSGDYNDCSYVILYKTNNKKIIFAGDSAEKTWNYILENYKEDVSNIDILLAPHHGRKTGGNCDYLDVLNPKLTLFGNAKSEYLDYAAWNNRNLDHITNNQANCVIMDTFGKNGIDIYVTYEYFAKKRNPQSTYNNKFKAWYIQTM